ncbi:GyrI-like domain-containing protein [Rhodococcus qingshengii]|uniref:GyrI-like domain-containing protein n=1 Tax=Rhodococcus qingshengii TaxID=334542 RepID=UPI0036011F78
MEKYDVKKAYKDLYSPGRRDFALVTVPRFGYFAVDGHGDPNTATEYSEALEALYSVSYATKFASKKELDRDFVVGPLEGLWRADDPEVFVTRDKSSWDWTMMISQPEWITETELSESIDAVRAKAVRAKKEIAALDKVRFLELEEGLSVQILHVGSYDDEAPTLDRLHNTFIPSNGLSFNGDHHEIYLSDARRTPPEKLKTVLRQPVSR